MTKEARDTLLKAADLIDAQTKEIETLRVKVASFERTGKARGVLDLQVKAGLMHEDAVTDEAIRRLAESGKDLDKMASLIEEVAPQVLPWARSDEVNGGASPESRRDAWIYTGEDHN